jgi:hypothetical protein
MDRHGDETVGLADLLADLDLVTDPDRDPGRGTEALPQRNDRPRRKRGLSDRDTLGKILRTWRVNTAGEGRESQGPLLAREYPTRRLAFREERGVLNVAT